MLLRKESLLEKRLNLLRQSWPNYQDAYVVSLFYFHFHMSIHYFVLLFYYCFLLLFLFLSKNNFFGSYKYTTTFFFFGVLMQLDA